MQEAHHTAHGDQRRGDEQGADDNLDEKQDVAHGEAAEGAAKYVTALDRVDDIDAPDLPRGQDGEEDAAGDGEGDGDEVNTGGGRDEEVGGKVSGAPLGERAEQQASEEGADDAANERDDHGFGEQLAGDHPGAGADGETDGELARPIGSARREDAGEIGASGEQD